MKQKLKLNKLKQNTINKNSIIKNYKTNWIKKNKA